jgi:hypothetical protein
MTVNSRAARHMTRVTQICAQTLALAMPPVETPSEGATKSPKGTLERSGARVKELAFFDLLVRRLRLLLAGPGRCGWRERRRKTNKHHEDEDWDQEIQQRSLPAQVHRYLSLGQSGPASSVLPFDWD